MGVRRDLLHAVACGLALSVITSCSKAEVTYLSCSGTIRTISGGVSTPEEPLNFSLTVDTGRKTITVDGYEPLPFRENPQSNVVVFMPTEPAGFGVSTGTLHRITGEASVHIIKDGVKILDGICKPVQKLF
jgi:hypothetical protein